MVTEHRKHRLQSTLENRQPDLTVVLEEIYDDYDLIIDSTGLRAILPMSKNRIMIPCLEYRIKYKKRPYEDFFIKPFKKIF